jgi:hypothetical protein
MNGKRRKSRLHPRLRKFLDLLLKIAVVIVHGVVQYFVIRI